MEIKLTHVKTTNLTDISITIPSSVITGITGENSKEILEVISFSNSFKGSIYFDKERITKKKQNEYKKKTYYVPLEFELDYPLYTVEEYLRYFILTNFLRTKDIDEKIDGALKIVGFDKKILKRTITTLSSSEKKWFQLSLAFLINPSILLLDNPFIYFDEKEKIKLVRILERLKDKFHKTIIITSSDQDLLYEITRYLVVLKDGYLYQEGITESVYYYLFDEKKLGIPLPKIVSFIKLVESSKKVKLDHRKDIKDLMKDIYREVR